MCANKTNRRWSSVTVTEVEGAGRWVEWARGWRWNPHNGLNRIQNGRGASLRTVKNREIYHTDLGMSSFFFSSCQVVHFFVVVLFFPFFLLFSLSLSLPPSRLIYNCSSPNDRFPIMKWRLTSRYSSPQRSKPSNRADLPYRYRVFVLSFLVFFYRECPHHLDRTISLMDSWSIFVCRFFVVKLGKKRI